MCSCCACTRYQHIPENRVQASFPMEILLPVQLKHDVVLGFQFCLCACVLVVGSIIFLLSQACRPHRGRCSGTMLALEVQWPFLIVETDAILSSVQVVDMPKTISHACVDLHFKSSAANWRVACKSGLTEEVEGPLLSGQKLCADTWQHMTGCHLNIC